MPLLDYRFSVDDLVWVLDSNTIKSGTVKHIEYDNYVTETSTLERLRYIVLLTSPNVGTIIASDENTFSNMEDALYALSLSAGATPTPTPSATPF